MKLLHPEVEIVPGRPGMRPPVWPVPEAQPIPGSAVVRVTNTTGQENAYVVRLRCDESFWQERWVTVLALPPNPERAENAPPTGKADQRGPHDSWVKVYVPRGGTRDILLRFNVPQHPESRAGRYHYRVEIETQLTGPGSGARRSGRITEIPAVAIVRPFYKWDINMTPEQPRVGLRHRTAEFTVVVTNEGNDWLYCDLDLPRPKDMILEAPTLRLAVPPPESGEMLSDIPDEDPRPGTQRVVPLKATTRLRVIRGEITPQSILLNATRIDAPSTPPPLADASYGGLGAVVAEETDDTRRLPGDRALNYCPPVPARLVDFFGRSGTSLKGLIMTIIGVVIAFNMLVVMYENLWHNTVRIEPLTTQVTAGGVLPVKGDWLPGSKIMLNGEECLVSFSTDPHRASITVPKDLDGKKAHLKVQRFVRLLPFLTSLLPSFPSPIEIQVGSAPTAQKPVAAPFLVPPGNRPYHPKDRLALMGGNLGPKGLVFFNGSPIPAVWTPTGVTLTIPADTQPGSVPVTVTAPDGTKILSDASVTIVPIPVPVQKPPVQKPPLQQKPPVQQPPVQKPPVQQTPVKPPPVQKLPVKKPPIQPPVQKPPVQQPPVVVVRPPVVVPIKPPKVVVPHKPQTMPPVVQNPPVTTGTGPSAADQAAAMQYAQQGNQYANNHQYDQAIAAFQQALQLDPTLTQARRNLATVYNNKGLALARLGRDDEAIAQLKLAIQTNPDNAAAQVNLGVSLYNKGDKTQARDIWNKVVKDYPYDPAAAQAQGYLNQ